MVSTLDFPTIPSIAKMTTKQILAARTKRHKPTKNGGMDALELLDGEDLVSEEVLADAALEGDQRTLEDVDSMLNHEDDSNHSAVRVASLGEEVDSPSESPGEVLETDDDQGDLPASSDMGTEDLLDSGEEVAATDDLVVEKTVRKKKKKSKPVSPCPSVFVPHLRRRRG